MLVSVSPTREPPVSAGAMRLPGVAATTVAVGAEAAVVEPSTLVAVTSTRIVVSTSAVTRT